LFLFFFSKAGTTLAMALQAIQQRDAGATVQLLAQLAEANDREAVVLLGLCRELGIGGAPDLRRPPCSSTSAARRSSTPWPSASWPTSLRDGAGGLVPHEREFERLNQQAVAHGHVFTYKLKRGASGDMVPVSEPEQHALDLFRWGCDLGNARAPDSSWPTPRLGCWSCQG
jgi:hypothetical protein